CSEAFLQLGGGRGIVPDGGGVTAVLSYHSIGRRYQPGGNVVDVAVEGIRLDEGPVDLVRVRHHPVRVEVAESSFQLLGDRPCSLSLDSLVADHPDQKCKGVFRQERIGFRILSELHRATTRAELGGGRLTECNQSFGDRSLAPLV